MLIWWFPVTGHKKKHTSLRNLIVLLKNQKLYKTYFWYLSCSVFMNTAYFLMTTCKCHMFKFNQWIIGTYYKLPLGYQNQGNFPWFSCFIEQLFKRTWMYSLTPDLMYNSRLRFFMNQILELTDFCVKCPYFAFSLQK